MTKISKATKVRYILRLKKRFHIETIEQRAQIEAIIDEVIKMDFAYESTILNQIENRVAVMLGA